MIWDDIVGNIVAFFEGARPVDHPVTLADVLLVLAIIGGLGTVVVGALIFFAGSMSDAPAAGDAAGKQGCITFAVGIAVVIGSLWALLA